MYILTGIAVVLACVAVWTLLTGEDINVDDPILAKVLRLEQEGDVEALAQAAGDDNTHLAAEATKALGRMEVETIPHVKESLKDRRQRVREAAAGAIGNMGRPAVRKYPGVVADLARVAMNDDSVNVRASAVTALGKMRAHEHMEALLSAMDDPDAAVRGRAAKAVSRIIGREYGFRASAPRDRRRQVIKKIRGIWPEIEPYIREYYSEESHRWND